jgi:hypothetical protein
MASSRRCFAAAPHTSASPVDRDRPCSNVHSTSANRSACGSRAQLPRLGVGHGLRLLRFPSSGRRPDADGAGGGAAAFAASARAHRLGRSVLARRDPAGRERPDRAGQIRDEIGTCEIGQRTGTAPLDRLSGRGFAGAAHSTTLYRGADGDARRSTSQRLACSNRP